MQQGKDVSRVVLGKAALACLETDVKSGSVLHLTALWLEGQRGEPREWCSCSMALEPAELPRQGELGWGCAGPQSAWAGKGLIRSGRKQSLTKNRELLCEAKELVFLKRSYRAQAGLCAACLVTCSASILPAASPGPPPPSLNSPDLLSSSFLGSIAVGRHWLLLPPATGGVWAPASPGFVQDGLRKEPSGHLGPPGRRNRAVPEPPTVPAASASPHVVLYGEVASKRAAPRWCFRTQHRSLCSLQEAGAGLAPADRSTLPSLLAGSTGLGASPVRQQM